MRGLAVRLLAFALAPALACASGCASGQGHGRPSVGPELAAGAADEGAFLHFLARTSFGATPASLAAVKREGASRYLESQLHPERIDDAPLEARLAAFQTLHLASRDIVERYYQPAMEARRQRQAAVAAGTPPANAAAAAPTPLSAAQRDALRKPRVVLDELGQQKLLRAVYSERQLRKCWSTSGSTTSTSSPARGRRAACITEYERDAIRPHVLGTFRDLLGATAREPGDALLPRQLAERRSAPARTRSPVPSPRGARCAPCRRRELARRPPNGAARGARAQRELRARADGAAHARRRRRLHAAGRRRGGARLHRLDDCRSRARAAAFVFEARQHDAARRPCSARRSRRAAARTTARRCSTSWRATRPPRASSPPSSPPLRRRRAAGGARRARGEAFPRDRRRPARGRPRDPDVARVLRASRRGAAKVKTPFEFVASALRATGADVVDAAASVQAIADARHAALRLRSRRPATATARTRGSTRRAAEPHELRARSASITGWRACG